METQQFILSNYINDTENHDSLLEKLKENGINSKDYKEQNLTILFNKYDMRNKSPLQMECRSIVIERDTRKILSYSCPTPLYNIDAVNYMWKNSTVTKETFICYEGSLLSIFNNGGNWYIASRKCIYNPLMGEELGQFKMFMDVIRKDGGDFTQFTNKLDTNTSYHFVLIHHMNENVVNYNKLFGENYMKLCFIFARNKLTQSEYNLEETSKNIISDNIFLPISIVEPTPDNYMSIHEQPDSEGVVIKIKDKILKIQNASYQFHKAIGSEKNMFRGFITLYQTNSLKTYFETNINSEKFKKIVNPLKLNESYDTIGMIDALFKVCTSELFTLFTILYKEKDGMQQNNQLYNVLPDDYKNILYSLRGIFFNNMKNGKHLPLLMIRDVYNFLKIYDIKLIEKFIRTRKLMLNWIKIDNNPDLQQFTNSLYKSDKVFYKMATIYTSKMFPEIMNDDIPPHN